MQALLAGLLWGVMPIYFKALQNVPALEVVGHRILWSVPLLLFVLWLRKNLSGLRASWQNHQTRLYLLLSSILIAANWLIYVWAIVEDHILAASLGYFISPLLNVVLGKIFLKEKLSRYQWLAVAIAAVGVSILALEAQETLWISLMLAGSWGCYSLVRKIAPVGPVVGLTIETSYLLPFFLAFLLWVSFGSGVNPGDTATHFGQSRTIDLLLMGGAIMTAVPLLLFASAVKKMQLSTIGLLQYIAPTIQFLLGIFLYNEPLTLSHTICFALIWISLAIYSVDTVLGANAKKVAAT